MSPSVGCYHHTGSQQVMYTCCAQRPVWYSVCAAVFNLKKWCRVVKTIDHYLVIKMSSFNDIFVRYVIVAGNQSAPPDVERRARPGDKSLFNAGHRLYERINSLHLS